MLFLSACATSPEFRAEVDEMLHRGITDGDLDAVKQSVAAGATIDRMRRGRFVSINMVEFAADMGRADIARWLIDNGADVNHKTTIMGETLLMSMAVAGEYELVRLLLERGADVNAKNRFSDTALEYALKADGNVVESEIDRLVTLLLEHGAKIRRQTLSAALNGHTGDGDVRYGLVRRIVLTLRESGDVTNLHPALKAAILGDGEAVLSSLSIDGRISPQDKQQIMFYTAAFGSAATLGRLADMGQSLTIADKDANTPLIIAARYGNAEVVKYLIDRGADLSARNRFGKTASDVAAENGNVAIAAILDKATPTREVGLFGEVIGCYYCRCSCIVG